MAVRNPTQCPLGPATMATGNPPRWPRGTHHSSHGEEVRVVAALLQVHHDVEQRHLVAAPLGVESLEVPREDELVVLPTAGCGTKLAGGPRCHQSPKGAGTVYRVVQETFPQGTGYPASQRETVLILVTAVHERGRRCSEQGLGGQAALLPTPENGPESQMGSAGRGG